MVHKNHLHLINLCGYASYGRNLMRFNLQVNTPSNVNLSSLFVATGSLSPSTNSQTVVFAPQDALKQNNGLFNNISLPSFSTELIILSDK